MTTKLEPQSAHVTVTETELDDRKKPITRSVQKSAVTGGRPGLRSAPTTTTDVGRKRKLRQEEREPADDDDDDREVWDSETGVESVPVGIYEHQDDIPMLTVDPPFGSEEPITDEGDDDVDERLDEGEMDRDEATTPPSFVRSGHRQLPMFCPTDISFDEAADLILVPERIPELKICHETPSGPELIAGGTFVVDLHKLRSWKLIKQDGLDGYDRCSCSSRWYAWTGNEFKRVDFQNKIGPETKFDWQIRCTYYRNRCWETEFTRKIYEGRDADGKLQSIAVIVYAPYFPSTRHNNSGDIRLSGVSAARPRSTVVYRSPFRPGTGPRHAVMSPAPRLDRYYDYGMEHSLLEYEMAPRGYAAGGTRRSPQKLDMRRGQIGGMPSLYPVRPPAKKIQPIAMTRRPISGHTSGLREMAPKSEPFLGEIEDPEGVGGESEGLCVTDAQAEEGQDVMADFAFMQAEKALDEAIRKCRDAKMLLRKTHLAARSGKRMRLSDFATE